MNNLIDLLTDDVTSIEPCEHKGVKVIFRDGTYLKIEYKDSEQTISILAANTQINPGSDTSDKYRIKLNTHVLTKAKLIVQELTAIIEKIEAEQA